MCSQLLNTPVPTGNYVFDRRTHSLEPPIMEPDPKFKRMSDEDIADSLVAGLRENGRTKNLLPGGKRSKTYYKIDRMDNFLTISVPGTHFEIYTGFTWCYSPSKYDTDGPNGSPAYVIKVARDSRYKYKVIEYFSYRGCNIAEILEVIISYYDFLVQYGSTYEKSICSL